MIILYVFSAQNYVELGNDAMLISVMNDGKIIWEPGIVTETSCAVNIGGYNLTVVQMHPSFRLSRFGQVMRRGLVVSGEVWPSGE